MASKLEAVAAEAMHCTRCELYRCGTQTVFGEGPEKADVMLVGEQPGDVEDRAGEPFVGPAGRVLDEALAAAGIERDAVYLTNAVKHFRFEERGKRRIHKKPGTVHVEACHPWLAAELAVVRATVVVCLGATAGRAVLGRDVAIGAERGQVLDDEPAGVGGGAKPARVLITAHPSAVLRLRGTDAWDDAFGQL